MVPAFDKLNLPLSVARELRSDHAGETGAVWIYKGILAVSRDDDVRAFAEEHLETEQKHLAFFERWMPTRWHTRLTPLWKLAGWLLGALPALFGRRAVFATIRAVETFVDDHYLAQIEMLEGNRHWQSLREQLQAFRQDEIDHRDDAAARIMEHDGMIARAWARVVETGSAAGVMASRRL